jgi:hypothetical protein
VSWTADRVPAEEAEEKIDAVRNNDAIKMSNILVFI